MLPGDLNYKTEQVYLDHCEHEHSKTLSEIEFWVVSKFGMMVTCSYRKKRHAHDLHGVLPVRAKDIRSWCYDDPKAIAKAINDRWTYDPTRPTRVVALYHDSGNGSHIHLQVHPRTRRR